MGDHGGHDPHGHLTRSLLLAVALAALAGVGIVLYAEPAALADALASFRWAWLPAALALTSLNYLLRFARWQWYLARLEIALPLERSVAIFLGGLAMAVTPGKVGEALKCVLLRRSFGVPLARSGPVVLAERLTDLVGVALLAALAALASGTGESWALIAGAAAVAAAVAAVVRGGLLLRLPLVAGAHPAAVRLLGLRPVGAMSLLAALSWFFECLAAFVCLRGLGLDITLLEAVLVFALASLAGAVSLLPGGFGATEASMTGLIRVLSDATRAGAAAGTVLVRLVTLGFAVAVGLVALAAEHRMTRGAVARGAAP